ncbi:hypothetical protein Tco_0143673 [Tanacetum coccineum]
MFLAARDDITSSTRRRHNPPRDGVITHLVTASQDFTTGFPTEKELAYHKELLGEPQPPFSTLEPKIRRDFMILEDLGIIINSGLSEVVLGQPFAHTSKLTYDESLRLIRFAQRDDEVVFRMPQRIKELDLISSLEKDKFEAYFVENLKVIFDEKKLGSS